MHNLRYAYVTLIIYIHTKLYPKFKVTFIEQLTETENVSRATLKFQSKRREDFWILKLNDLTSKGLNQKLSNV